MVGSIALDTVTTSCGTAAEVLGGSATYFSCACRLFAPVRVVGIVGKDFPARHVRFLKRFGVDLAGLRIADGLTFRWTGSYVKDINAAETLSVSLNVMDGFIPRVPGHYRGSRYVFLANIDPVVQLAVLDAVERPALVVCDTMNHWITDKPAKVMELIGRVDVLVLNDGEARLLTGEGNLLSAGRKVLGMGPKAVIIKKGEHGAMLMTAREFFAVPAFPVEQVLDPTGAGDSFGGGFTGCLAATGDLSPRGLRRAIVYGTVVASFTVEGFSTRRLAAITRGDVEKRLARLREYSAF